MRSLANVIGRTRRSICKCLGIFDAAGNGVVPRTMRACGSNARLASLPGRALPRADAFRLIYLAPSWDGPVGGNKVIYQHVEAICREGIPCFVFHPDKPGSSYTWMAHQVQSLKEGRFRPEGDFLVFPEIWAALAAAFCVPAGIKYAIFVQNGYLAHHAAGFSLDMLERSYRDASYVLSISTDTTQILKLLFPFLEDQRIVRVCCSVPTRFSPASKEPLIAYMPRKLRGHAERLELYLRRWLPSNWKMAQIDRVTENEVVSILSRSSIFLSFCDMEGYGLPPVEAALCGNVVVGYTGQAAKEYFHRPIFRSVEQGDFIGFVREISSAIHDVENGILRTPAVAAQIAELASAHSAKAEADSIRTFVARARSLLNPHPIAPVTGTGRSFQASVIAQH